MLNVDLISSHAHVIYIEAYEIRERIISLLMCHQRRLFGTAGFQLFGPQLEFEEWE